MPGMFETHPGAHPPRAASNLESWRQACADGFEAYRILYTMGLFDLDGSGSWKDCVARVRSDLHRADVPTPEELPEDPSLFQVTAADMCHVREIGPRPDGELRPWQRLACLTYTLIFAASRLAPPALPHVLAEVIRIGGRFTRIDLVRLAEFDELIAEHDYDRKGL